MCRYANVPIGCAQLIIQFYEWPSYQLAHWHIGTFMHYFFACSSNCFPFSMASSIVPTFRKACSGRSSTSPSRIIRKPLIVSSMETITPGTPVNCSATEKGCERNRYTRRARFTSVLSSSESSSIPKIEMISCNSLLR